MFLCTLLMYGNLLEDQIALTLCWFSCHNSLLYVAFIIIIRLLSTNKRANSLLQWGRVGALMAFFVSNYKDQERFIFKIVDCRRSGPYMMDWKITLSKFDGGGPIVTLFLNKIDMYGMINLYHAKTYNFLFHLINDRCCWGKNNDFH